MVGLSASRNFDGSSPPQGSSACFGPLSLSVEMNITHWAENHTCHEKQTERLPVRYSHQSENLRHGNVPEKLKNQRHDENSYDRETEEKQSRSHCEPPSRLIFWAGPL